LATAIILFTSRCNRLCGIHLFDSWFLVVMPVPVRNCGPDCDPENWNSGLFLSTDRQVIPSSGISELWMLITLILRRAEDFPVSKLILIDLGFLGFWGVLARLQPCAMPPLATGFPGR
jgi:hypothetical protein